MVQIENGRKRGAGWRWPGIAAALAVGAVIGTGFWAAAGAGSDLRTGLFLAGMDLALAAVACFTVAKSKE